MAQPTPVLITTSTTSVKIDVLEVPYTPVILNNVEYTGQTLTVYETTNSPSIVETPIVLSTTQGDTLVNIYTSNAISTLINQPLGFVTVQSQLPSTWNFLNSFPFRNQYVSAGVLNITASTINTSNLSSVTQIANILNVQNLTVTNFFSQTADLVIIADITATGSISLASTLNVWDTTRFSSGLSTIGYAAFYSSFYVKDDLFVSSSLVTASTVYVSSLYVTGSLSTSKLCIGSSLVGTTINVLLNDPVSVNVAGNVKVDGTTSVGRATANAEMNIGSRFTSKTAYFGTNLFLLSSLSLGGDMIVDTETTFANVRTGGDVISKDIFTAYGPSLVDGDTSANDINIQDSLYINQHLNAQEGHIEYIRVDGNFINHSTSATAPSFSTLGNYSAYDLAAATTTVTGNTSTLSNLVVINDLTVDGADMRVKGNVSTIGNLAASGIVTVSGDIHVEGDIVFSGNATFNSTINILSTFFTNSNTPGLSTTIAHDLSIQGNAYVAGTAIISSYTLDPAITTSNFYVSTFHAAYLGIVSSANISTLFASTVAAGGISNATVMFNLSGTLSSVGLTTQFLSTGRTTLNQNNAPNSYFYTLNSLGVSATAAQDTVEVASPVYLLSSTTVENLLSTFITDAYIVSGTHIGDGSELTDVSYPAQLSTGNIEVSSIRAGNIYGSNFYASSGIVYKQMEFYSTLQVGQFYIFGDTDVTFSNVQSNAIFTNISNYPNTLFINGLQSYFVSPFTKKAYVNQPNPDYNTPFTLEVNGTTIVRGIESPGYTLSIRSLYCETAIISSMNIPQEGPIYIESGAIGPSSGTFFIGQQESNINLYTNIIQPYESTLRFNETLFVNHEKKKVGILTDPIYTLDVNGEIYNDSVTTFGKLNISDLLKERQQVSTIWVGTGGFVNGVSSNVRYSYDGENWVSPTNLLNMTTMYTAAYNGFLWVGAGNATGSNFMIQYSSNLTQWNTTTGNLFTPGYPVRKVAWNGSIWVAVGATANLATRSIAWSATGTNWTYAATGGFAEANINSGGFDVGWNGSVWVAGGAGNSAANSILYSGNGRNWSNAISGGMVTLGIVWAERNWIACGFDYDTGKRQVKTSLDGRNWRLTYEVVANGIANKIAYGNGMTVMVVEDGTALSETIFYSQDFGTTWTMGQGNLFVQNGRTVAWNGSYWIAGGDDGVRKSYDGITWFNPGTAPGYPFYGLGYSSNTTPFMNLASPSTSFTSPETSLKFYNEPLPGVLNQTAFSVVSVSSNGMSFNNSFFMDSNQNVTIPYAMTPYEQSLSNYTSSFVLLSGVGRFSTLLTAPQVRVGGLYLGTQTV